MQIEQPGPVTDRITFLGRNESCVYLVNGIEEYAILGGSMTCTAPDVISQIRELKVAPEKITRLFIHHSHFDHVGLVPVLKKAWPWLQITATARGKELLARKDVVETIVSLNRMLLPENPEAENRQVLADAGIPSLESCLDIEAIGVDETVADGDILTCGDLDLLVIEVPGHSSCSAAVYIPQEKALSASDAGGIPFGGRVFAAANSNFDQYQESLEKMAAYPCEVHLSEHYGALTGAEGRNFMARSIEDAKGMRALVEKIWAGCRDRETAVAAIMEEISAAAKGYFLPKEVMAMVLGQMVRFFEKRDQAPK